MGSIRGSIGGMRMSQGVEWALHCCLDLAWAEGAAVPGTRLAELHELPPAYLTKQLQALTKAGIVRSTPGPRGGYRLTRDTAEVTVLEVVTAVEGGDELFRCTDLLGQGPLQAGPRAARGTCAIHLTMSRAEQAWRRELAGTTIADLSGTVAATTPDAPGRVREWLTSR